MDRKTVPCKSSSCPVLGDEADRHQAPSEEEPLLGTSPAIFVDDDARLYNSLRQLGGRVWEPK